jgi:phenylacetate-CoA ligase
MLATTASTCETTLPQRLGEVLPRWLKEVPLYQATAAAAGVNGTATLALLQRLPLLTKADLRRDFPRNVLRPGVELEALLAQNLAELEHTSGTSEERTPLLLARGWWNEQEARALRLNGHVAQLLAAAPDARRVTVSSPVCNGDISYAGVPAPAERTIGTTLFVSLSRFPFLWTDEELARLAAETVAWQPVFLDTDPVYAVALALYCERQGLRLPSLRFILCSYEFVSVTHRRLLERAFGVPVYNLYGSTETGHLLMEDDQGQMTPSLETAFLEILEPDSQGVGDLIVSTFTNEYLPLLRYRIGDLVARQEGAGGPTYVVHGRARDAFRSATGARVTTRQIDECFAEVAGIAHYQMRERPGGEWRLRFVPDHTPPSPTALAELRRRLTELLGLSSRLALEETDLVMPESSGKFLLGYPAGRSPV